jgi:uncharacterized repeat protein (TIGR04138 family)
MINDQTLEAIRKKIILSGRDDRYTLEAYGFVLRGLNFYHTKAAEKRHFTGQELSRGLIEFAHKQFGPITGTVLQGWGIHTTDDLGYIVYNLISINLIRKQDNDALEDFFDVLDIDDFLNKKSHYTIDREYIKSIKGA